MHLHHRFRNSRAAPAPRLSNTADPLGTASRPLIHKVLVIFDLIQNTLGVRLVPSCAICVTSHDPLPGSDRMRKLILRPLPGSFAIFLPTDSAEEPTRDCSIMNTYAARAERRRLPRSRALVLALSVILAAAWQVACGGGGRTGAALTPPAPVASVAPSSLSFGNQTINTTSAAQTVTLTNTGNAALSIAGITFTGTNAGDFAQTNACGSSVAAGGNCTIAVTFTSTATGARAGTLTVTDNNNGTAGSTQTISLSGTGTSVPAPVASLTPLSLAFGNQTVNNTSTVQTVTLSNTGNAALSIVSLVVTGTNAGDFAQSNTCGGSVAASGTCTISVTFTPVASDSRTASVSIMDNASGSPQTVSFSGTGTTALVSLSPTSLPFGNQSVGVTSAAQTVTLSNTGTASLSITSLTLTGTNASDFTQSNTCGSSLAAGGNCTISVTFTPSASGSRTASVSVADSASGSPQTVSLSGTGTAALVSLSPTSLPFGNQSVGATSTAQTVTLSNTGNAALSITSLALTGTNASDFAQSNTCGSSLAAGANCTIAVMFTPSIAGTEAASLSIADNASGSPQTVSLSGAGTHDVILSWAASTTPGVVGYDVYRGATSGGESATPLNSSPINGTTYCDATVQAGQTYYYVITAVASNDVTQSADSNQVSATVP